MNHFLWHPTPSAPTLLHGSYNPPSSPLQPSKLVAALDLDGTLIENKSRGVYPTSAHDWRLLSDKVVPKLRELHAEGYTILLLTNQGWIPTSDRITWFKAKMPLIAEVLGVPFHVFAATKGPGQGKANDLPGAEYRKPRGGMWDVFVREWNGGLQVDMEKSFFVGDAAGRPATRGRSRDHSDSDLVMARNVGLPFKTPEEIFI